jgi:hypothetical protein
MINCNGHTMIFAGHLGLESTEGDCLEAAKLTRSIRPDGKRAQEDEEQGPTDFAVVRIN